jgi:hypothetical protein
MRGPRRLTTVLASTACYRDSFTFSLYLTNEAVHIKGRRHMTTPTAGARYRPSAHFLEIRIFRAGGVGFRNATLNSSSAQKVHRRRAVKNYVWKLMPKIAEHMWLGDCEKKPPWHESTSELCQPRDRRLSAKLVPTFADKGVSRS